MVIQLLNSPDLFKPNQPRNAHRIHLIQQEVDKLRDKFPERPFILLANKVDELTAKQQATLKSALPQIQFISAKEKIGIEELQAQLLKFVDTGALHNNDAIVTNSRHYSALLLALEEINKVQEGLNMGLSSDLLAIDIRQALYHFGEITGQVTNDELLGNIFANFCIGK